MGSSNKKKREKKKDFQKPKLKVGKSRPKATKLTDPSFQSKAIVLHQQNLVTDAANLTEQFKKQLSVATTARSDDQRRDALSYLCNQVSARPANNPVGTLGVLTRTLPLISDSARCVRGQLLKLLRAQPPSEIRPHTEKILMYIRGGLTHLADDIRGDTLDVLEWLLDVAGDAAVSCPGGWLKTLNSFSAMLGWNPVVGQAMSSDGWTSASVAGPAGRSMTAAPRGGPQALARQIQVLTRFLEAGFRPEEPRSYDPSAYWDRIYTMPRTPNPFAYLNLFGAPRDEDGAMYADRESRVSVFDGKWRETIMLGMEAARGEAGAVGRAAAGLHQVLRNTRDTETEMEQS